MTALVIIFAVSIALVIGWAVPQVCDDCATGEYGWAAFGAAVTGFCVALLLAIVIGAINTAGVN